MLARERGLPNWDKPAAACLASRIPYGTPVTAERLAQIERAEEHLHGLGFRQVRVRHHGAIARLELEPADLARAVELRETIVAALRDAGFTYVTLDLAGFRSGSMNLTLIENRPPTPQPPPYEVQGHATIPRACEARGLGVRLHLGFEEAVMDAAQLKQILVAVQAGRLSVAEAVAQWSDQAGQCRISPCWITAARRARGCRRSSSARARHRPRSWRSSAGCWRRKGAPWRTRASTETAEAVLAAYPQARWHAGGACHHLGRRRRTAVCGGEALRRGGHGRHQRHPRGRGGRADAGVPGAWRAPGLRCGRGRHPPADEPAGRACARRTSSSRWRGWKARSPACSAGWWPAPWWPCPPAWATAPASADWPRCWRC